MRKQCPSHPIRSITFITLLCLWGLFPAGLQAMVVGHWGTDFWVAFSYNFSMSSPSFQLFITSETGATGQVQAPGQGFSAAFTVPPGGSTTVVVPNTVMVNNPDGVSHQGIHITASNEVAIYGINDLMYRTDGFLALPTASDGRLYYIPAYQTSFSLDPTALVVVGTQNTTSVTVTLPFQAGSRSAGVPYVVALNQGDTYQIQGSTPGDDATGTKIESDKPVAVFGINTLACVPNSGTVACNHLVEQIWPVSQWGTEYLTFPLATRSNGDTFRFLASQDGTTVTVNGSAIAILNAGQFVEQLIAVPSNVTANHPFYCIQYANDGSFDGATADPTMISIPAVSQYDTHFLVSIPAGFTANYLNVVSPNNSLGSILLDGVPISTSSYSAIGTTGFSGAQISVPAATHALSGPDPFYATVYGFATFDAYGYPAGVLLSDNPTPTLSPTVTMSPSATPSWTTTPTPTPSPSSTFTATPTPTSSLTQTSSPTFTLTPTATPTPSPTCVLRVWPNPLNPSHAARGTLKMDCLPIGATIRFYTVSGELVRVMSNTEPALEWDAKNHSGLQVKPGIYFYSITRPDGTLVKGIFLVVDQ